MSIDLKKFMEERGRLVDMMSRGSAEEVRQWYDECAHLYNVNYDPAGFAFHTSTVEVALEHVKDKNAVILDVGAGTGNAGELLKNQGYTTIDALDGSQPMLDFASKKNIYRELICCFVTAEPIPQLEEESYDAMIASGVFASGGVSFDAVPMLMNYLKKGGLLIFSSSEVVKDASSKLVNKVVNRLSEEWQESNLCSLVAAKETLHAKKEPAIVYTFKKL